MRSGLRVLGIVFDALLLILILFPGLIARAGWHWPRRKKPWPVRVLMFVVVLGLAFWWTENLS